MKQNNDFRRLLVLSGAVVKKTRKRTWAIVMAIVLSLGTAVPAVIFGARAIQNFLNHQTINFSGDYLPTNLCKKAPFDKLEWCELISEPMVVNYDQVIMRDTRNELYSLHSYNGKGFARYDIDPSKSDGEIRSSNLRYEYAYNTIVQQIIKYAPKIDPEAGDLRVTSISVVTRNNPTGAPLSYDFVDNNQLEALTRISVYDKKSQTTSTFNAPLVIFNNSNFYNRFFNFMGNYHQIDVKNNAAHSTANQLSAPIISANARDWIVPAQVWAASATNDLAVNTWLYKYMTQNLNYLYLNNWREFAVQRSDLSINSNPFSNFIIYAPSANPLFPDEAMYYNDIGTVTRGLASILINPNSRDNIVPIGGQSENGIKLTSQLIKLNPQRRVYAYMLFLSPQYKLNYYWEQFGANLVTFYARLNDLINFDGDTKKLLALLEEYPFIKELSFAPFQQTLFEEGFDHKTQKQHWYLSHGISFLDNTTSWDITDPKQRSQFLYRYWSAINKYSTKINSAGDVQFINDPVSNPDLKIDNINISEANLAAAAQGRTINIQGVSVNSANAYLDTMVRLKMYNLILQVNTNYSGIATDIPANFVAYNQLVSSQDVQFTTAGAAGEIFEQFRSKDNGINTAGTGYFTTAEITTLLGDQTALNNVTSFQAFYNIGGRSPYGQSSQGFGEEPLAPYRLNYFKQLYNFHITWVKG